MGPDGDRMGPPGAASARGGLRGVFWRFGLWLRKNVPLFQEERLLGRLLICLRALWQIPLCLASEPDQRGLIKAWLCLRLAAGYSMIAPSVLFRMYDIVEETVDSGVKGSIVECGVWNGGSAALLAMATGCRRCHRDVWLFDSFKGLPRPTREDPREVRDYWYEGWNAGERRRVQEVWRRLGIPSRRLRVRAGWFHLSFRAAYIDSISVLHIDCDWHDSVKLCLEKWYDKVQPGGAIILNDYNLYGGVNKAVHDFLESRGETVHMELLGRAGAWFAKPGDGARRSLDRAGEAGRARAWSPQPQPSPPFR